MRTSRSGQRLVLAAVAGLVVVIGATVALRASATTSVGRDVLDVVAWAPQPDDIVVAVLSDVQAARHRSTVVVLDPETGEETGRLVTGPSPHVALDAANGRMHLAFESLAPSGQVNGVAVSLDMDRGRVVAADTVPAPWGTPIGLVQPALFASGDGEFLVYAHFVRRMDPRGEQTRNEAALSVLDAADLGVVDTLELDSCAAGRLGGPPSDGVVTLLCNDDDGPGSVVTVQASADGFDRGTLVRAQTSEGLNAPLVATGAEDASDVAEAIANVAAAARGKHAGAPLYEAAATTSDAYYVSLRAPSAATLAGAGLHRVDRASGTLTAEAGLPVRSVTITADGALVVAGEASDTLTTLDPGTLTPLQRWRLDTDGTPIEYVTASR